MVFFPPSFFNPFFIYRFNFLAALSLSHSLSPRVMSIPVRSNLLLNNTYYCDWRIWAHDCEDVEFFSNTLRVNAFIHMFCVVGFFGVAAFKVSHVETQISKRKKKKRYHDATQPLVPPSFFHFSLHSSHTLSLSSFSIVETEI